MRSWVAGQLKYAADCTWFIAPYVNSYKRFQSGTFAPTKAVWADNRTAGYRLCGEGRPVSASMSDRWSRSILSRLRRPDRRGACWHRREAGLEPPVRGCLAVRSCRGARTLRDDQCARARRCCEAFGEDVVEHYLHTDVGSSSVRPSCHRLGAPARLRALLNYSPLKPHQVKG